MKKEGDTVQRKEVKAVLFDLDGVLIDSINAWFYVINDTLKHFGFKTISKTEFKKRFGAPIEEDVETLYIGKTIKEVEQTYNLKFKNRKSYVKLFPQSINILKKLKKSKLKLGIITNSPRFITSAILSHFKLKKYFDVVITTDDVKRGKPAPDMVLKACKKLGVEPKNTILVGDTNNDMVAGKNAGCITVGYKIKGDYRIDRLNEVTKFI